VIDFTYLRQHVPYVFPDVILKLDPAAADGYLRHWDVPAGQVEKHLSYAYQWFGFAVASVVIGLTQMVEKRA
jgi:surfeit locus 1 family protein